MVELLEIFLFAVILSVDAFSVALGVGCRYNNKGTILRLSLTFGFFQFFMPLLGAFIGKTVGTYFGGVQYLSAAILFIIAIKMIKDSLKGESCDLNDPSKGFKLIALAVATSVDALGVGFTLSLMKTGVVFSASVIGVTCAILTAIGILAGKTSTHFIGKYASYVGATVLIIIGIKMAVI